jgi:hypothetical protein
MAEPQVPRLEPPFFAADLCARTAWSTDEGVFLRPPGGQAQVSVTLEAQNSQKAAAG